MAKKTSRVDVPFACPKCHTQLWSETNVQTNRLKGVKKLEISKYCSVCREHVTFVEAKPPSKVQQGGKKKR